MRKRRTPLPKQANRLSCAVTGQELAPEEAIRFVIAPSGQLVPDIASELPGQAFYVNPKRCHVQQLGEAGQKEGILPDRVVIPPDLAGKVYQALIQAFLNRLGLAKKAAAVALGAVQIEEVLSRHKAHLLLEAGDVSTGTRQKMRLKAGKVPVISVLDKQSLAMALGVSQVAHIAVTEQAWAKRLGKSATIVAHYNDDEA